MLNQQTSIEANSTEITTENPKLKVDLIPNNLKPIEFIDYYMNNYSSLFSYPKIKSTFNNDEKEDKSIITNEQIFFPLYEFFKKEQLSQRIFKSEKSYPTAIAYYQDEVYIGDSKGIIHKYSFSNEYEFITYEYKFSEEKSKEKIVKALDCSRDGKFIISGYSNGIFIIWQKEPIKSIYVNVNLFKTSIVALKLVHNINYEFELVASDLNGGLYYLSITKIILVYSFDYKELNSYIEEKTGKIKNNKRDPFFIIEIFKLPTLKIKDKHINIIVVGSIDIISVFIFHPKIQCVAIIPKPDFITNNCIAPDISIGEGYYPPSIKNLKNEEENTTILVIAWEKYIKLYTIELSLLNENEYISIDKIPNHHFINNNYSIIRVGFITISILFILDSSKKFKIINTFLLPEGDFKEEELNNELSNIYNDDIYAKAIITQGQLLENEIYADDFKYDNENSYFSYRTFIIPGTYMISFLSKNRYFYLKLLSFQNYVTHILTMNLWDEAMTLGLNVYKGKILTFAGIPMKERKRKEKMQIFLKELTKNYLDFMLSNLTQEDQIEKCLTTTIDYCFNFNGEYFLLEDILNICLKNGYGDIILKHFKPLILNDSFKNQKIPSSFLTSLFSFYFDKKELVELSHLFTYFTYDNENIDTISNFSKKFFMYHTLSYIFDNSNKNDKIENKFTLIRKLFDLYNIEKKRENSQLNEKQNQKMTKSVEVFSFKDNLLKMGIQKFENTKEFLGEYLLWYINVTIDKALKNESEKILIVLIFIWLLSKKTFSTLLTFDSFSFFYLLNKILTTDDIINAIKTLNVEDNERDNQLIEDTIMQCPMELIINSKIPRFTINDYQNIEEIIEHIIKTGENFSSFYITHDLNMFKLKIARKYPTILGDDAILKSIENILMFLNEVKNTPREETVDKFNCHGVVRTNEYNEYNEVSLSYIVEISETINYIIQEYPKIFNDKEKKKLEMMSEEQNFHLVSIKFLEMDNKYKDCFVIRIKNLNNLYDDPMKLFDWINMTFESINQKINNMIEIEDYPVKDRENIEKERDLFKKEILNKFEELSKISMEKTSNLIDEWYERDKKSEVISSISNCPMFKVAYIEKVIDEYLAHLKKKESFIEQEDDLGELCHIYIQLLIQLNRKKKILDWIKKIPFNYPIEEILTTCLNGNESETCVYLYQKLDKYQEALDLAIKKISKKGNKIKNSPYPNYYHKKSEKFLSWIEIAIQICENSSEKETQKLSNIETVWYKLFSSLNQLYDMVKEEQKTNSLSLFENDLLEKIEKILTKMLFYIPMDNILNKKGEIKFKQFRNVIMKVLRRFTNFCNVLSSTKSLLQNSIVNRISSFKNENLKGFHLSLSVCDFCQKEFARLYDENIITFSCGHKGHQKCLSKIMMRNYYCTICYNSEKEFHTLKEEEGLFDRRTLMVKRKNKFLPQKIEVEKENKENRKEKMRVMRSYEKHFLEMYELLK